MRHITDGELHAYLDAALDQLPGGRGGEVRDHLDACPTCKERLQDEEEIRSQATELLASTIPPEVELPSFEELRARAEAANSVAVEAEEETPVRIRSPLRGMPLAWAATVVLAIGVGWMGGEVWRSDSPPNYGPPQPPSPGLRPAVTRGTTDEVAAEGFSGEELEEAGANASQALLGALEAPDAAASEGDAPEGDTPVGGALARQGAPSAPEPEAVRLEAARRVSETVEAREKSVLQESPSAGVRADRVVSPPVMTTSRAEPAANPMETEADAFLLTDAVADAERSMAVPGLEVLTVEWEEWIPGERALHIRQLLPMGDTLELRYVGLLMGSDPEALDDLLVLGRGRTEEEAPERSLSPKVMEASLPAGWNQVVMRWRRGWLVARAPLSEESLRGILLSVR